MEQKEKPAQVLLDQEPMSQPLAVRAPRAARRSAVKEQVPIVPSTAMDLLAAAAARGASVEELAKFMELLERQQANEARQAYMRAVTAFKRNAQTIYRDERAAFKAKNKDTGEYSNVAYDFATLGHICEQIIAQMAEHSLSHRWVIEQPANQIRITCVLSHEQGHSETASIQYSADNSGSKNPLQAVNSSVTYGERTSLLAVCGIAVKSQGDDDAGAAGASQTERGEMREAAADMRKNSAKAAPADLLEQARAAAAGGTAKFGPYWRGISQEQRTALLPQLDALQKQAAAASAK